MNNHVLYNGRMVPKEGFRAYVFSFDGQKKIADSFEEFEELISSGVWFTHADKVPEIKKQKKRR